MTVRQRLTPTRSGKTHKLVVGPVELYITVNHGDEGQPLEMFTKATEGYQAEADGLSILISLALQYGAPAAVVAKHLRHRRYAPHGLPGQPCSISDALGRVLEAEGKEGKA